ncbi:MAG TPA: RidA family protein [Symbiobacteriaceae bacterium]|nr:RidA family protein [Symbiobacteriaceae bacterium]
MSRIESRLREMGYVLPDREWKGRILACRQEGNLLFCSGHGCRDLDGGLRYVGQVGKDLTVEQGKEAARNCALNTLAAAKAFLGDLDRIEAVVKVLGFVSSADGFGQQPEVMHGYTDLWAELLGEENGRHARSAIGTNSLPGNQAVEVECVLRVRV